MNAAVLWQVAGGLLALSAVVLAGLLLAVLLVAAGSLLRSLVRGLVDRG